METETNRVLSACALRDLDHHSNTPLLQHSLERYVQAKPIDSDHAQRTWISESN